MKKLHEIKLREEFCDAVLFGDKTFEIRENDRGYQKEDLIRFKCVNKSGLYVNHEIDKRMYMITYVLSGWGLRENYVAFSILEVEP